MNPLYHLSEDEQHMEMVTEDGSLYTFDRITDEDLDAIRSYIRSMNGGGEDGT